jgi:hypothetical protein
MRGNPTESTGLIVAPLGGADQGPVLTWLHGTTGNGDAAAPSLRPDPARELITYFDIDSTQDIDYGVPSLQRFIDDGWIVCATDYQGQGTSGVHQYALNRTNARDGLFIVHAAHSLNLGAGTQLAAAGWSQGAGASAALCELDDGDFGDLELLAGVHLSPGVPAVQFKAGMHFEAAAEQAAKVPVDSHAFMLFVAIAETFPDRVSLDDLLTPLGERIARTTYNTLTVHHLNDVLARAFHHDGPIMRSDPRNLDAWVECLAESSAGQVEPRCPVLVCQDMGNPEGHFPCPLPWQDGYVARVRELGGDVTVRRYADDDHFSLCTSAMPEAKDWLELLRSS